MKNVTEKELKAFAEEKAKTIVVRTYDENGNSNDERRATTEPERKIIYTIIYGALLAIRNNNSSEQTAKDTAEFIGNLQIPEMNGYDTIYIPISKFEFPED